MNDDNYCFCTKENVTCKQYTTPSISIAVKRPQKTPRIQFTRSAKISSSTNFLSNNDLFIKKAILF